MKSANPNLASVVYHGCTMNIVFKRYSWVVHIQWNAKIAELLLLSKKKTFSYFQNIKVQIQNRISKNDCLNEVIIAL